jgi:hypothetical protein
MTESSQAIEDLYHAALAQPSRGARRLHRGRVRR